MANSAGANRVAPGAAAAALQGKIKAIFREAGQRGKSQASEQAFALTQAEKQRMSTAIAGTYTQAKAQSYAAAVATTALLLKPKPYTPDADAAGKWADEQVDSISSTYDDQANSTAKKAAAGGVIAALLMWLAGFINWKVTQITLVVWWSGVSAGTKDWIDDSDDLNNYSSQQVQIEVVPSSAVCDICAQYAGNTYDISEIDSIPDFPIHPNCQHSIQIVSV